MILGHEFPEIVRVEAVGLGVSPLRVYHVGELDRIADEKERKIEEDPVPFPIAGKQLGRHALQVLNALGGAALQTSG